MNIQLLRFVAKPLLLLYALAETSVTGVAGNGLHPTDTVASAAHEPAMEHMPGEDLAQALKGRVAGLDFADDGTFQLRGSDAVPLIIVNGVPYPVSVITSAPGQAPAALTGISAADVEKVEFLKGIDATAIWGPKASNGALYITTRKSRENRLHARASFSFGFSKVLEKQDLLSTDEYISFRQKAFEMDGITPNMSNAYDLLEWGDRYDTDWQDLLMGKTTRVSDASFELSGGSGLTRFYASLNYQRQGMAILSDDDSRFERIGGRLNVNRQSADGRLNLEANVSFSSVSTRNRGIDPASYLTTAPNQPLYDEDGGIYWYNSTTNNPLSSKYTLFENANKTFIASLAARYNFSERLSANLSAGYNFTSLNENGSYANEYYNPYTNHQDNAVNTGYTNAQMYRVAGDVNYNTSLSEQLRLTAQAGFEWQADTKKYQTTQLYNYPSSVFFGNPTAAAIINGVAGDDTEYRYLAGYSRFTLDWKSRYQLSLTYRRDASSRFKGVNTYTDLWAVGASWLFYKEKFARAAFLTHGKLRGSVGESGNDNVGASGFWEIYSVTSYPYNGQSGVYSSRLKTKTPSWERVLKRELAVELGLFNRVDLTLSGYINTSRNLIMERSLASQAGSDSGLRENVDARIENRGLEVEFNSQNVRTKNFSWETNFNVTFPKNKLIRFPGLADSPYYSVYEVGKSTKLAYAYKFLGIDRETGIPQVEDHDGDGVITSADKQFVGDFDRDFYGGLGNTFRYKAFQLDVFFYFSKQPMSEGWQLNYYYPVGYLGKNTLREVAYNSWTPENPDAKYPGLTTSNTTSIGYAYFYYYTESSASYCDASFIRLQNVNLTYTVPRKLSQSVGISRLDLFVKAQNLYTWSKYNMWDPASKSSIPAPRTVLFGVSLTL